MTRPLTAKRIAKLRKTTGRYRDSVVPGLYLQVSASPTRTTRGAASWVLRYERNGRERMLGLGPLAIVSLKQARDRAREARVRLLDNVDPVEQRKQAKAVPALQAARTVTFQEAAVQYFKDNETKWSRLHAREFIRSLERLAFPAIGALPVGAIDTGLVLRVIEPPWKRIPETASRLRGRIEMVLDWATVRGLRAAGDNPARWSGHIQHLLPPRKSTDIKHFATLPYAELPRFWGQLQQREDVPSHALAFAVLTAARSGEIFGAHWREFDLDAGVWTIPFERMKSRLPHRVPLSEAAITLLKNLPGDKSPDSFVFTRAGGRALAKDSLERALARIHPGITVHGMRSSFRDWCSERTSFSYEVCERALAHITGNKSSRAYARSDLLDERRKLMSMWADFCYGPVTIGELVPMRKARS
jgi:integrase